MIFKTKFNNREQKTGKLFQVHLNSEYYRKYKQILKHHNIEENLTKGIRSVDSFFLKSVIDSEFNNIIGANNENN